MCLLDHVKSWDQTQISCMATSHRNHDNPLRTEAQLGIVCGIEYAAQAMAVHGALLAPANSSSPKIGYLVSVRGVTLHAARLDTIEADLQVNATCIMANAGNMLYEFMVSASGEQLLQGRAAVMQVSDAQSTNVRNAK